MVKLHLLNKVQKNIAYSIDFDLFLNRFVFELDGYNAVVRVSKTLFHPTPLYTPRVGDEFFQ